MRCCLRCPREEGGDFREEAAVAEPDSLHVSMAARCVRRLYACAHSSCARAKAGKRAATGVRTGCTGGGSWPSLYSECSEVYKGALY